MDQNGAGICLYRKLIMANFSSYYDYLFKNLTVSALKIDQSPESLEQEKSNDRPGLSLGFLNSNL